MATDSERYEPSSSSRTGTPPDEFFKKIRACGFGRPKCRPLQAKVRCPFLPRRCERGADWALLHGCKASQDGPFQSFPNTAGRLHSLANTDEGQPNISGRSLFCATKPR